MTVPTTTSWFLTSSDAPEGGGASGISGTRGSGDGKTGIAVPVSADGRGRFAFTSGDDQTRKIIFSNLSDCDSANPFQELGIGEEMVFAVNDERLRIEVRRRVNFLFRRLQLQDRARLAKPAVFVIDEENQELSVEIDYINLEEDKPGNMSVKFQMTSTGGVV